MKDSIINLPLTYKIINGLCRIFVAAKLPSFRLDEQSLFEAAIKQAELEDFGDPYFREGLRELLRSLEQDANLHPLGRLMVRKFITNFLVQRLLLAESRKKEKEIYEKKLPPPILITGLARSGTTFLHNMLALNPTCHALPQWLLLRPFPEKQSKKNGQDPRLTKAEKALQFRRPLLGGLDRMHYTRADSYEECILALGLTFNSLIFGTLHPVYSYMDWYLKQENTLLKYQEYKWLLQLFQSLQPTQTLTLKAPAHMGNLEAILKTIPDAMVIQTHRDPVACISSVCSLVYTFHGAVSGKLDLHRMSRQTLDFYEIWLQRNLKFRAENPNVVCDVYYNSLVTDPIATVRKIYEHFHLSWTDEYENELIQFVHQHPKDKHGKHHYAATDFGLKESEIRARLGFYTEKFGM